MTEACAKLCCRMRGELSLFRYLDERGVVDLARYFQTQEFDAGAIVWREGDGCAYVGFVAEGEMEYHKGTEFAGRSVVVAVHGRGAVVGELCVLDNEARAVTATARTRLTLVVLPREALDRLLEEYPELGVNFLKGILLAVSIRLRKTYERLAAVF